MSRLKRAKPAALSLVRVTADAQPLPDAAPITKAKPGTSILGNISVEGGSLGFVLLLETEICVSEYLVV